MPRFITLPSGLVVNLDLVGRMVPTEDQGERSLALHFSTGDSVILSPQDASALQKRVPQGTALSSNARTAVFWFIILVAMALVYFAVRTRS